MSRRVGRRLRLSVCPPPLASLSYTPTLYYPCSYPTDLPPSLYCSVIRTPTEILLIKRLRCCDGEDRETVDNLKLDRPFVLVQGVRSFLGANEPATVGLGAFNTGRRELAVAFVNGFKGSRAGCWHAF